MGLVDYLDYLDYFDNLKILGYRTQLLKISKTVPKLNTKEGVINLIDRLKQADDNFNKTQDIFEYREELKKLYELFLLNNLDLNSASGQDLVYRRNMAGVALTGVFANHSTHHAKSQYVNFNIKDKYGIKFNEEIYTEFNSGES